MLPPQRPADGELWVTALDVGPGTAVLIEADARTLLHEIGPRFTSGDDAGGRIMPPYLRWRGNDAVDLLVVSHLDSDQSGGAASLLGSRRVGSVLTSIDPAHPTLRGARGVRRCEAGQRIDLGALRIDALRPRTADCATVRLPCNAASCVLRVTLGAHRVLLTGDLPARQEIKLVSRVPELAVDRLSVPHHGSRGSSSEALLDASRPAWASVRAGYHNRFGQPDAQVLARYLARGVHVVRSDESGAAQWRFRGGGAVKLHRWRASAHRYWNHGPVAGVAQPAAADDAESAAVDAGASVGEPLVPY